ncbi:MAG: DMT family transporter [Candidatus Delongbacteria bacterium]|nr:DMT family transporter [Candidatus Delongbacteria bacterium]MBN2836374.1 DMT family transporter [Candidatus Delongbacteria bacterium]
MSKIYGFILISFAAVLWGLDGVVLTPRLFNLNPAIVVLLLHLIPFVIMQPLFYKEYAVLKTMNKKDYLSLSLISLLGGTVGTLAIVKSLFLVQFNHLSVVIILQKLQPVFGIALASIVLKEKLRPLFYLLALLALVFGYFLTFGFEKPDFNTGNNLLEASAYAILAAFSFGSSTVFGKSFLSNNKPSTITFFRFGMTSIITIPFVLFMTKLDEFGKITIENLAIFLLIAFTTGTTAIFIYYNGLRRVRASVSTIAELCFPLSAIVFDYLINDKHLTIIQWIAAIMLTAVIVIISKIRKVV